MESTFYSLIPPLVAIVLCIALRQAALSLFIGVFTGALLLNHFSPHIALMRTVDHFILSSLIDTDHAVVILFTLFIGGQVEILNRSGATMNLVRVITSRVSTRRSGNVLIWTSGLFFFIDDYANVLIVGNAYRRVVDGLKISREKLAYLIDTTAAPISSLALVSTWIGFEISVITGALETTGNTSHSGFELFISSIPYRFYPLLALFLALLVSWTGKDFGPMVRAEKQSRRRAVPDGEARQPTDLEDNFRLRDSLAVVPLLALLVGSIAVLAVDGYRNMDREGLDSAGQAAMRLFSSADPFRCLLAASIFSSLIAVVTHGLFLKEGTIQVFNRWLDGCKEMFTICVILTLAWSIGDVCKEMQTGPYVASLLGEGLNSWLPLFTFLFATAISFATGTSYGTMAILMPVALPIAVAFGADNPAILYGTVGSVLGGAIFGDHCSPLSDTTILSSGASGCSLTAHVSTQLPYALAVALVSLVCLALLPLPFVPVIMLLLLGGVALAGLLHVFGRDPGES